MEGLWALLVGPGAGAVPGGSAVVTEGLRWFSSQADS